jgi:CubicO group peptidase (beta-lactamase class C family)
MRYTFFIALLAVGGWLLRSEAAPPADPTRVSESVDSLQTVFKADKLAEIDAAILQAIAEKKLPGGVLWLEWEGVSYHRAYGNRAVEPVVEPMTEDTIFDAASLTKVLATAPAVALLIERGQLKLDAPAREYLPEFKGHGKDPITLRHLLTHTSGLRPGLNHDSSWSGYRTAIHMACAEAVTSNPGTVFHYSDINFIVLGEIVRRVSGMPLEDFVQREFYGPLKMVDTRYLPPPDLRPRIAPTERTHNGFFRGTVHDPTARLMGGVAGHAGVFTTAADLARFARMMLNGGSLEGARIFAPETIRLMTTVQSPESISGKRGLGWDIDSAYAGPRGKSFPVGSYGHTGWTGTSLWIDPASRTFIIFLSNRNHPTEAGNVLPLRVSLGTLAAESLVGFNYTTNTGVWPPGEPPAANYEKNEGKDNAADSGQGASKKN